jgi:hypothetical protein
VRRTWKGFEGGERGLARDRRFFADLARSRARGRGRAVTQLAFRVAEIRPESYAAVPTLLFALDVEERTGTPVHSLALRAQVRIEPQRREYGARERERLGELFGEPARWGRDAALVLVGAPLGRLAGFTARGRFDLAMPVSYDFEVAAAKYLHALEGGAVPLRLLFSGTVFESGPSGIQIGFVPWNLEATCELPRRGLAQADDEYFPNGGWLRLHRETLDALLRVKADRALSSFDDVIARSCASARDE